MIQILYACSPCNSRFSQLCFDTELKASDDHCETLHSVVSLAHLFYCTHCDRLACRDCSLHEPASYYCPVCLFEVPSATVQSEHGRCSRNCFNCPVCSQVLSVVPYLDQKSSPAVERYTLSCSYCRWDAHQSLGWLFDKPMGISGQVQKLENEMQRMGSYRQELMNTRLAYENYVSVNHGSIGKKNIISSKGPSTPTGISRPTSSSSTTSSSGQKHAVAEISCIGAQLEKMSANEWISWVEGSNSVDLNQDIAQLIPNHIQLSGHQPIATDESNHHSASVYPKYLQLLPQRSRLRAKWIRRCCDCQRLLVKPEPKVQLTQFKVRSMAQDYLPELKVIKYDLCATQKSLQLLVRIINPLDKMMPIEICNNQEHPNEHLPLSIPDARIRFGPHSQICVPTFCPGILNQQHILNANTRLEGEDDERWYDIDNNDSSNNVVISNNVEISHWWIKFSMTVNWNSDNPPSTLLIPVSLTYQIKDEKSMGMDGDGDKKKRIDIWIVLDDFLNQQ